MLLYQESVRIFERASFRQCSGSLSRIFHFHTSPCFQGWQKLIILLCTREIRLEWYLHESFLSLVLQQLPELWTLSRFYMLPLSGLDLHTTELEGL